MLGQYQNVENRWVGMTLKRMLDAQPEVLELFSNVPFGEEKLRAARVSVYRYRLLSSEQRRESGNWWSREWVGQYSPQITAAPTP